MPPAGQASPRARDLARKRRNEAYLRRHWRVAAPLLVVFLLGLFLVPLFYLSFVEALCLQLGGAGLLLLLGKMFTTAFDGDGGDADEEEPPA